MSQLDQNGVYFVTRLDTGGVWMGPKPKEAELEHWCADLSALGITHVVSLIEENEVARYRLQDEGSALAKLDIGFTRFPVEDFDTPDMKGFLQLTGRLQERLAQGENLFLHCAGGVGRAGTLASCLLINSGAESEQAIADISKARGQPVPETNGQIAFIEHYYELFRQQPLR